MVNIMCWLIIGLLFQTLLRPSQAILSSLSGLYIRNKSKYQDQISLWTVNTPAHLSSASGHDISINWDYTLPNTVAYGLSVYNFHMVLSSAVLSYKAELTFVNTTSAILNFNPLGANSQVNFISFSILVITSSNDYLELQALEQDVILVAVTGGGFEYQFNAQSSKFIFGGSKTYDVFCFRQWVRLSTAAITRETSNLRCSTIPSTQIIEIVVTSDLPTYIDHIKVCLLIVSYSDAYPSIASYHDSSTIQSCCGATMAADFAVPRIQFGYPLDGKRCFFGLTRILLTIAAGGLSLVFDVSGSTITGITTYLNIQEVQMAVICLAQCPPSSFISSQPYICQSCSQYLPSCLQCISSTECLKCSDSSFLQSDKRACLLCSDYFQYCSQCDNSTTCLNCYLGDLVQGGCSRVIGCDEVEVMFTLTGPENVCKQCDESEFYLSAFNHTCLCKEGFLAGKHCTTTVGCTIAEPAFSGVVKCIFCNKNLHFVLDNSSNLCVCDSGYEFKNQLCSDICGDGRVFALQCDDGNTDDGDGCSSDCMVQNLYLCHQQSNQSPSICQYVGYPLDITLINTQKTLSQNQGVFSFVFSPSLSALSKFNISSYFIFQCQGAIFQVAKWTYSNGVATLYVDYQTNLQDNLASVTFSFDQLYIRHTPIVLEFTINSDDVMLIVLQESISTAVIKYLIIANAFMSVFLILIGSWFQKMVGVEMVNVLQIIYFTHFSLKKYTTVSSQLQYLSITAFSDLFLQKDSLNLLLSHSFQKIDFSINKMEQTLLLVFLMFIVFSFVLITFHILASIFQKKSSLFLCIKNIFYNKFVFPLILVSSISLFFIFVTFLSVYLPKSDFLLISLRSLLILFTMAFLSFGFARELQVFMTNAQQANENRVKYSEKPFYILQFEVYILFEIIFLLIWIKLGMQLCRYILLVLFITMLILHIKFCPYKRTLDNVSIILNFCLSIIFQVYLLLRQKNVLSAKAVADILILLCLSIFIFVCETISMIRVARIIIRRIKTCFRSKEVEKEKIEVMQQKEINEKIEKEIITYHATMDPTKQREHFLSYIEREVDNKLTSNKNSNCLSDRNDTLNKLKKKMIGQLKSKRIKEGKRLKEEYPIQSKIQF